MIDERRFVVCGGIYIYMGVYKGKREKLEKNFSLVFDQWYKGYIAAMVVWLQL